MVEASGLHPVFPQRYPGNFLMTKSKPLTTATFLTLAMLACLSPQADAAQCGSSAAGFEGWKQQFAGEARAKGISASTIAALMATNYAQATINADRGQRSFSPLARPVSRQARWGGHRRARAFAEAIAGSAVCFHPAALRRAAGTAARHLGNGDGFRQPARQSEHAVGDCDARLRLPALGLFHRAPLRGAAIDRSRRALAGPARLHARRGRPDPVHAEEPSWPTAPAISRTPPTR